jgi:(p)ppGpp synthase/HD superfamily hydrolase
MSNVEGIKQKITAVLHDIVEDTSITIGDLNIYGFENDIVEAINILTKTKNQNYMEYIELIDKNNIARDVKIVDLKHNMDISRLDNITDKDIKRVEKYEKAYNLLMYRI